MARRVNRAGRDPLTRALILAVFLLLALWRWLNGPALGPAPPPGEYSFCCWNAENLFDDVDDPDDRDADEDWFGRNPGVVAQKMANLAKALLLQDGGRGPDILALVEVENRRAATMLQEALNARLREAGQPPESSYTTLIFRQNKTGRRFAPAILSRLPGEVDESITFPATRRILLARFRGTSRPLIVLASHWTSRLTDKTGAKRAGYADSLYDAAIRIGPSQDLLICGDFNDEPDDPSIRDHLHATGDLAMVRAGGATPYLLDLMAGKNPDQFGTIRFQGRWQIFDQIVASPGLLDPSGWLILPETVQAQNREEFRIGRDGHPWRFGGEGNRQPRGYSDHFAVTVRLRAG